VRQPLLNGVAVAAAATVAMVLLGSLTLLPALIGFTGTRLAKSSRLLARGRNRSRRGSRSALPAAERWAAMIQRRPVLAAVVSTGIILALAAPALGMRLNFPDESAQARGTMGYANAGGVAFANLVGQGLPWLIAVLVLVSMLLLTVMFRSVTIAREGGGDEPAVDLCGVRAGGGNSAALGAAVCGDSRSHPATVGP
jgi:hypothetical protein